MGIHGIYKEIGPGRRIALSKLAVEKFEETGRPFRIAIDVSIWLFQIQASKGGTNPALRTFYYRLLRLISLSIHPIFVFDGPNKPPFKRNKRTGANVASIPEFLAKQLLKQFGFPIHLAPGEAEAECALLQREGIVDAVLSEDVDTLMFGSGVTIRNWSPEQKTGKTPTHVNVYDAVETKNGPAGLDREGMILIALMSGGDYVPEGIPGCGPKTACEAARAGFGEDLCKIAKNDAKALKDWRDRLQHELRTNQSKLFVRKRPSLKIPDDFPRRDILGYYTHPAISSDAGLRKLKDSIKWDQDLDFPGLRSFAYDAFDWVKLEGAKHFIRSLAPSLLVRHLRMRGEHNERFPTNDVKAIEEDEALLVKGIHGKRQHAVTDSTTELRVSFTPIDLVRIDLSVEEPDEDLDALRQGSEAPEADIDDEVPLELDDDDAPKKRGPTKFDPEKPARVWVLETYVKVGVPLKVQDWEAGQQKPQKTKRTASTNDANKAAPKTRATRATKPSGSASQATIERFAKVTKPGTKLSRALAKAQNQPSEPSNPMSPPRKAFVDLMSSSPPRPTQNVRPPSKEKSPSPPQEDLPPTLTKRRRGPIQRAQTLPSNLAANSQRPSTPPPDIIETLDLVDSPALPSPFQLPTKKSKTNVSRKGPMTRAESFTASPRKTKQSTLDAWQRTGAAPREKPATPKRAPPSFQISEEGIDTLDLTLSSPLTRPSPPKSTVPQQPPPPPQPSNSRRTIRDVFAPRPPLVSISSNASKTSSVSSSSTKTRQPNPPTKRASPTAPSPIRRTSPRLAQKTKSRSPEIESLDLTDLSPPPAQRKHASSSHVLLPSTTTTSTTILTTSSSTTTTTKTTTTSLSLSLSPTPSPPPIPRRSPRLSTTPSPPAAPAAWKAQAKKKRAVVLRKSLAGAWTFEDIDASSSSPVKDSECVRVMDKEKERARRKWRESEIEVLDLS
ncbi:hypothetical protein DM02DRAFT_611764 [Periconia macrospinosa]|uniref:Flap structure-specific endonuclease n=1 Tax=Periconia macrospinosa TaxID=97972 RepID=A0A2V1E1N5_9PLEO|nr:hypothetical protein DM02DRAFT_611764 [Periconia macrospinosa]